MDLDLGRCIRTVEASADDEIERIAAAAALRAELEQVGDDLLDHFVGEARAAGRSWAQIGDALGVTRQAAQQRHGSLVERVVERLRGGMFRRFAEPARTAVVEAQAAARTRNHSPIGTGHVLLGVVAAGDDDVAVRALDRTGVDRAAVERLVAARLPAPGDTPVKGHIPFGADAKAALVEALRESQSLGHPHIGTEHVLLALRRVEDGVAAQALADAGVGYDELREAIVDLRPGAGRT
jgi:Clp amino terminal domain, pathogenicity island component